MIVVILVVLLVVVLLAALLIGGWWLLRDWERAARARRRAEIRWRRERADFRLQQLTQDALQQLLREARPTEHPNQPADGEWFRP